MKKDLLIDLQIYSGFIFIICLIGLLANYEALSQNKTISTHDENLNAYLKEPYIHDKEAFKTAYEKAVQQARQDAHHGKFQFYSGGMPAPSILEYQELLKTKYNIGLLGGYGCFITNEDIATEAGYNNVMKPAIFRRFGPDILNTTFIEAKRLHKKKHDLWIAEVSKHPRFIKAPAGFKLRKILSLSQPNSSPPQTKANKGQ